MTLPLVECPANFQDFSRVGVAGSEQRETLTHRDAHNAQTSNGPVWFGVFCWIGMGQSVVVERTNSNQR